MNNNKNFIEFKGFLSFLILHELNKRTLCGEDLAELIGKRKGTVLTPGTIYPALKKLRRYKLLKWKRDGRKKYYYLTELGELELEKEYRLFSQHFYGLKKYIKKP